MFESSNNTRVRVAVVGMGSRGFGKVFDLVVTAVDVLWMIGIGFAFGLGLELEARLPMILQLSLAPILFVAARNVFRYHGVVVVMYAEREICAEATLV